MKKKTMIHTFVAFAGLGAISSAAVSAEAWSVRQNASYCMTDPGSSVVHDGAGLANYSVTAVGRATCPVQDTSLTPKTGITALGVHVRDGSTTGSVVANACVQFVGVPGGSCGAATSTPAASTGLFTLSPARTSWGAGNANDLPYLLLQLPQRTTSTSLTSMLLGYSFSG